MGQGVMKPSGGPRLRVAQCEVLPGRPAENTAAMLGYVADALRDGVEILVFPEMAVPGYLVADEWERMAFLRECEECHEELARAARGLVCIFGSVGVDPARRNEDGRVRKYNALYVAEDGRFVGPEGGPYPFVVKALLPNYREFDESRHFHDLRRLAAESGRALADMATPVPTSRGRLGCVLCEDGWDADYGVSPLRLLAAHGPDLLINASASPYTADKNHKRHRVFAAQARELGLPLVYANHVGVQNIGKTVYTFDGASCVYDTHGHALALGRPFEEGTLTLDLPADPRAAFGQTVEPRRDTIADIREALLYGTRKFMAQCGVSRVVVGASGGIDSAVVAALYARILPPENLLLVNLPSRYNSSTTISLARRLAANLGCLYAEVPIEDSVSLTRRQLDGLAAASADGRLRRTLNLTGLMLENVQARDRGARVLAALAAAFDGVFTCNANKSEATVGYTTLYGDLGGYLAGIADLWKTEVYALARDLNAEVYAAEAIPDGSLGLVPSAELSAAQNVDEGKGDPLQYAYHDCLFRSWVEWWNRATPEENLEWYANGTLAGRIGYEGSIDALFDGPRAFVEDLERWWNQYQGMAVAKRIQAPPVLAVKRRAFGFDHREALLGPRTTRRYRALKEKLLGIATQT